MRLAKRFPIRRCRQSRVSRGKVTTARRSGHDPGDWRNGGWIAALLWVGSKPAITTPAAPWLSNRAGLLSDLKSVASICRGATNDARTSGRDAGEPACDHFPTMTAIAEKGVEQTREWSAVARTGRQCQAKQSVRGLVEKEERRKSPID